MVSQEENKTQKINNSKNQELCHREHKEARSQAEFIAKPGIVVEKADESVFWLELADEREIEKGGRIGKLKKRGKK
ncbi:hypothetical protein JYT74_00045 [Crocinitomix catalasitica]|nr:hypothetical protein [Crocinitomix catalasitica]